MKKSMSQFKKDNVPAGTYIIEGLTFKGIVKHTEFLKTLIDESESYLIFTILTDGPLPEIGDSGCFSRFDQVIDLSANGGSDEP